MLFPPMIPAPQDKMELQSLARDLPLLLPVGQGTKNRLSQSATHQAVSLKNLSGIVSYDASEYVITVQAGTPLAHVQSVLAEHGQSLPFDPPLAEKGATMGGTVAAGLSGAGRQRYGGLRDFLIGIEWIDSEGVILKAGGKVVKNAAGFDLPKFFIGSMGSFGILTELTFKVFPYPSYRRWLKLPVEDDEEAIQILSRAASSTMEFESIDYCPHKRHVFCCLSGGEKSTLALCEKYASDHHGSLATEEEVAEWKSQHPLKDSESLCLAKIASERREIPKTLSSLLRLQQCRIRFESAGSLAWIKLPADHLPTLQVILEALEWQGCYFQGESPHTLWLGRKPEEVLLSKIKSALDARNAFPPLLR